MLDKIQFLLEECEKRGFEAVVNVSVHRTNDNQKVQHAYAQEFIQYIVAASGGHVYEYEGSMGWQNSRLGNNIGCSVFFEKPMFAMPVEEYRKMTEELERLRAGQLVGGTLADVYSNQPEL